jgi:predicted DCC family thiol-disulfide oxidoreductase YuxK
MRRLAAWDTRRQLSFVSLHEREALSRWPDLSHEELMRHVYVIDARGRRHPGVLAFRYLARALPALWPLAPLLHIPFSLPIWRCVYRLLARNRYRIGGPACDQAACRSGPAPGTESCRDVTHWK